MEKRYAHLVSLQGDEYRDAEAIADKAASDAAGESATVSGRYTGCREWVDALAEYLAQWDYGDPTEDDVFGTTRTAQELRATSDRFDDRGEYILSWDTGLQIASLYRVSEPESE